MSIEPTPLDPGIAIPNPGLTNHEYRHAYIGGIYPTHVFSVTWDFVFWLSLQPDGPARVIIDWGIAGPVNLPKNQPDYPNFPYPALIEQVNEEDRMRVESVQKGAESGFARQGSMNHHEETIWYWAQYLHGRLAA